MSNYRQHFNTRKTHQSQAVPGTAMVQNNAGGYVFEVSRWTQLERFLILGSEGNTYYVSSHKLTVENAENVLECVQEDGPRAVRTILDISQSCRAPKNDPALFALAICAGMGDETTRRAAFEVLPQVARIGTHILTFVEFMEGFRGWGRAAKRGVGNWFTQLSPDRLGYQYLKYAQRGGWAMRDLLRLTHPKASNDEQNAVFRYIVKGEVSDLLPRQIQVAHGLSDQSSKADVIQAINEHRLTREMVPTTFLNEPEVWEALVQDMPLGALIRNLGKLSKVGALAPLSATSKLVCEKITNGEALQRARIHPVNVLAALTTYSRGNGVRGQNTWTVVPQVVDALNNAFYQSFHYIQPTGKNILIALDISGSMKFTKVNGMDFLDARTASAAMSMATIRNETNWHTLAFCHELVPLSLSPTQRLDDVVRTISGLRMGYTDCSLPMQWALKNRVEVDAFIIYTDNETWYGDIHPVQALRQYRERMGRPAKLITCAMSATKFSIGSPGYSMFGNSFAIADPSDAGMLDLAGLDSAGPAIISDFIRN